MHIPKRKPIVPGLYPGHSCQRNKRGEPKYTIQIEKKVLSS